VACPLPVPMETAGVEPASYGAKHVLLRAYPAINNPGRCLLEGPVRDAQSVLVCRTAD